MSAQENRDFAETPRREGGGDLLPARVPPTLLWSYRAAFTLLLAMYFTVIYIVVRALQGSFGWSSISILTALLPTIIMGVFVVGLVPFTELPENWVLQQAPAARRAKGLCPACGYTRQAREQRCPECGSDGHVRPLLDPSWSALRCFVPMALIAIAVGVIVGETMVQLDERRFRREVAVVISKRPHDPVSRPRQWPGSFATLHWDSAVGFESDAPGSRGRR